MAKKMLDGVFAGAGFVLVVAVAYAIAYAGDVFTIDKDGTSKFAVSDQGKITVGATESYVNLVIQNDEVVAEADNKLDITADVLTVEGIRLENVNVSANLESSGAGGLDTGSELADRWYYVWVITNNNGTSVNGILTLAPDPPNPPTPPAMPSGYTKKRRVGAVKNNGSIDFLRFVQEGNSAQYYDVVAVTRILNLGSSTSWTSVSAAGFVPPTSRMGYFQVSTSVTTGSVGANYAMRVRPIGSTSTFGSASQPCVVQVAGVSAQSAFNAFVTLDGSQTLEYRLEAAPTTGGGSIDVRGYVDPI